MAARPNLYVRMGETEQRGTYNLLAHTLPLSGERPHLWILATRRPEAAIRPETRLLFAETLGNPQFRRGG